MHNSLFASTVAALASCALALPLSAQQLPRVPIPVPEQVRIDLVNSVLQDRQRIFRQPVSIDGCALSKGVEVPDKDLTPRIDSSFRDRMNGKPGACAKGRDGVADPNVIVLQFTDFYPESTEYINIVDPQLGYRPDRMIVVRVGVYRWGQESHIEEWVMIQVRPSVWRVMTVRVSGIGAA